jgi:arylsulfatase
MNSSERPNILLITTDQQRFDTIHALGNPSIFTPHLNWLCDVGTAYTRCYTDSPVCMAARATIMTGRHGYRQNYVSNGKNNYPVKAESSLPGVLTQAGYQTRVAGKMHFQPHRAHYGFEHMELLQDYYREAAKHPEWGIPMDHGVGQNEMEPVISTVHESHSLTRWTVDRSINFFETRDTTRPFFLWTSFSKPHPPFDPPANFWKLYEDIDIPPPLRGDWSKSVDDVPRGLMNSTLSLNCSHRFSSQQWKAVRRAYYALITHIDYSLGLLFSRMRELDLLKNTLIIFTADHGEMLGDHHMGAKSVFLEGSSHIPMLLKVPEAWQETSKFKPRVNDITCLADIYPTCLAAAGVDVPKGVECDGVNLLERASSAAGPSPRKRLFGVLSNNLTMTLEGDLKYIYTKVGGSELLFDLKHDPMEKRNLIKTPRGKKLAARLRKEFVDEMKRYKTPLVKNNKLVTFPESSRDAIKFPSKRWPGFHTQGTHYSEDWGDVLH